MNDSKNKLMEDRKWIVLLVVLAVLLALGVVLYTRMSVELDAHPEKTALAVYGIRSNPLCQARDHSAESSHDRNKNALHVQGSAVSEQDLLCLG